MRKTVRKVITVLGMMAACILINAGTVQAAKAVKVERKEIYTSKKSWAVYTGKTKAGKKVWTYTTKKGVAAQLSHDGYAANKSYVYILDGNTFIKLNLATGKKVLSKKLKDCPTGGQTLAIDGKGNFYAVGYLDNDNFYKFSPKGKLLWKCDLSKTGLFWYYKIKVGSSKVTVYADGPESWKYGENSYYAIMNTKTGKLVKYSNPEK